MMLITATTIGALCGRRYRSKCHRKQPVCAQYSPKVVRPKATRTHTLGAELPPAATPPDHAIESAPPAASWQDDFLHAVIPCLLPSAAAASSGSAAACITTASEDSSEEEDVDGVEDFGPAMQAPLAAARAATPTLSGTPSVYVPDANRLWCEEVRERVVVLHWPRIAAGTSGDAKGEDGPDAALMRDYEECVRALTRRTTPFGLVHDFRAVERLATLTPIVGRILPDAIAISKGGLVRRVCLLHSFKSYGVRFILDSLVHLSPVRPSRLFHADEFHKGIAWAAAWNDQAAPRPHGRTTTTITTAGMHA